MLIYHSILLQTDIFCRIRIFTSYSPAENDRLFLASVRQKGIRFFSGPKAVRGRPRDPKGPQLRPPAAHIFLIMIKFRHMVSFA